jgi:hypothetical protein
MLKELENLLAEIARQQGVELGPRQRPQPARPAPVRPQLEVLDAEVIEAEPVRLDDRNRIAPTMGSTTATSPHKTRDIQTKQVHERADVQVHDRFDEQLSHMGESVYDEPSEDAAQSARDAAGWIAEMFRNPQTTRQAIVLKEVLSRPIDRW